MASGKVPGWGGGPSILWPCLPNLYLKLCSPPTEDPVHLLLKTLLDLITLIFLLFTTADKYDAVYNLLLLLLCS